MTKNKRWRDPFAQRESEKYHHPIPSREYIADFLNKSNTPLLRAQIAQEFEISGEFEEEALRRRLRAMVRDGQLMQARSGEYKTFQKEQAIQGRVVGHKDGFGFVEPEDGTESIFISARQMRAVLDGDIVTVQVVDVDRHNRREGLIVNVIEHKRQQIVGRFFIESGIGFVEPENPRINQDIIVPQKTKLPTQPGQMVIVEITAPPTMHTQAIGQVIEVLGDYMAPGLETDVAIRSHELPYIWSEQILMDTKKFSQPKAPYPHRQDLRELHLVTIDGEDAQDFDDAVYCEPYNKSEWRLVVAIADVSHYVKPGSALDVEAINRGNSVYFPGRVIPMLPPELSNDLCSLKPNVDRLSMVCDMIIDKRGDIKKYDFYRAVINSHVRFTYTEVAELLKRKDIMPNLKNLQQLYKVLYKRRKERGGLEFESQEIKVEFDKNKKIKRLVAVVRNDAHRLIEECMLCANISAARFLVKHKCAALFRVHDGPTHDKLVDLREFLDSLGLRLGGGDLPTPLDYAELIEKTSKRHDAALIQSLLLRSMSKAFYSASCEAHFGLAFDEYAHFTSPIRRYPDLLVHRAIAVILDKKKQKPQDQKELQTLGEHFSMTERRADEATRDVMRWLQCEYISGHLGKTFDGVITGVTGFGLFVQLKDLLVEGLVHISVLPGKDFYQFDPARHRLVGRASGKKYCLGDSVQAQVVRVNVENREIDFNIA
ncbi:MAG: ribonuclease R [Pseudomonadota bacterium]|mgnify:CR=1 FL=1